MNLYRLVYQVLFVFILSIAVSGCVTTTPQEEKQAAPKVILTGTKVQLAIIEFQNLSEGAKKKNMGAIFTELLTTSFVNSDFFKLTEREQLRKIGQELELSQSGLIDLTQAKKIGKLVGADVIITGGVTKWGSDLRLDARIIDVESGVILIAEKIVGKTDLTSMGNMADNIVKALINKYSSNKRSN